jgi:hypothetical protein
MIPDEPRPNPFHDELNNYERYLRDECKKEYREGFTSGFMLGATLMGLACIVLMSGLKPTSSVV